MSKTVDAHMADNEILIDSHSIPDVCIPLKLCFKAANEADLFDNESKLLAFIIMDISYRLLLKLLLQNLIVCILLQYIFCSWLYLCKYCQKNTTKDNNDSTIWTIYHITNDLILLERTAFCLVIKNILT